MIKVTSETDKVVIAKANEAGQGHIFSRWDDLSVDERRSLVRQADGIDFQLLQHLNHQRLHPSGEHVAQHVLKPPRVEPIPDRVTDPVGHGEARRRGEEAIAAGKVGIVMVSGGAPLGPDGDPTGFLPIGPVSGKSVFQLHAEKVLALGRRHKTSLPWWVVNHPDAHDPVREYFREHNYFGLTRSNVHLWSQPLLPLVDRRGKLLLAEPGRIAMESNGHGGVLLEFLRPERLAEFDEQGIEYLFFFLVDNPLVKIADPVFLGRHILSGADATSKAIRKASPDEAVGVFCRFGKTTGVIEYSELGEAEQRMTLEDGSLAFDHGNMAVHVFSVAFFRRMAEENLEIPFHTRERTVPYLSKKGRLIRPTDPNCHQFRYFMFDALRVAQRCGIIEVQREEEFSPIKNAGGDQSPQTALRDLSRLWVRWLKDAGARLRNPSEDGGVLAVEVSPLFALDDEELREKIELPLEIDKELCLEARG